MNKYGKSFYNTHTKNVKKKHTLIVNLSYPSQLAFGYPDMGDLKLLELDPKLKTQKM